MEAGPVVAIAEGSVAVLERIDQAGAHFQSLTEAIDTTTSAGRMMMHVVGTFAEFERSLLKERTRVGLDEARKAGRVGGRRPKLSPGTTAGSDCPGTRLVRKAPPMPPVIPRAPRDCLTSTRPASSGAAEQLSN